MKHTLVGAATVLATAAHYNSLPLLEAASEVVEKKGLIETMLGIVGPVFLKHEVHNHWGVYLLHHHWNVNDDEIAGEDVRRIEGDIQYMTKPVSRRDAHAFVPLTLALSDGVFKTLEVSRAPFALEANEVLAHKPGFLAELAQALSGHDLGLHFGLAAFKPPRPEMQWTEFTPSGKRASVFRSYPIGTIPAADVIDASWRFVPGVANLGGRKPPPPYVCGKMCSGNCYSVNGIHATPSDLF